MDLHFHLSVALSNILVVLLAVLILVEGSFSEKIQKINSSKWIKSVLLLWVMYIIYFFIFGSFTDTFWLIKRISLLLLLPIFYSSSFSEKTIQKSVFAFLISMFLSSVIAIAENYEIINLNPNWILISAFLKYTDHNVFLAFSLIISFILYFQDKIRKQIQKYSSFFYSVLLVFSFYRRRQIGSISVFIFSYFIFDISIQKKMETTFVIFNISICVFSFIVYNTSDIVKNRFNYEAL